MISLPHPTPFSPSLISLTVSVDVKRHVYSFVQRCSTSTERDGGPGTASSISTQLLSSENPADIFCL